MCTNSWTLIFRCDSRFSSSSPFFDDLGDLEPESMLVVSAVASASAICSAEGVKLPRRPVPFCPPGPPAFIEVNRPTILPRLRGTSPPATLARLPLGGWLAPPSRALSGLTPRIDPSGSATGLLLNRPAKLPRLPLFGGGCWFPPPVVSGLLLKIPPIAPEILARRPRLWCAEAAATAAAISVGSIWTDDVRINSQQQSLATAITSQNHRNTFSCRRACVNTPATACCH